MHCIKKKAGNYFSKAKNLFQARYCCSSYMNKKKVNLEAHPQNIYYHHHLHVITYTISKSAQNPKGRKGNKIYFLHDIMISKNTLQQPVGGIASIFQSTSSIYFFFSRYTARALLYLGWYSESNPFACKKYRIKYNTFSNYIYSIDKHKNATWTKIYDWSHDWGTAMREIYNNNEKAQAHIMQLQRMKGNNSNSQDLVINLYSSITNYTSINLQRQEFKEAQGSNHI